MRMIYEVNIIETFYKTVTVEASNEEQAYERARNYDSWLSESDMDYCESEVLDGDMTQMEGILDVWYEK